MTVALKAPFPWYGGKSRVAAEVWLRFGEPINYVEPFFGSGAVLLGRPGWHPGVNWIETANDACAYLTNFWRAVSFEPDLVAHYADWPVDEADLTAWHQWLVREGAARMTEMLFNDPYYCDPLVAGKWVWGLSQWIGNEWCSGKSITTKMPEMTGSRGVIGKDRGSRPHLARGQGVHKKRPLLSHGGRGVQVPEQLPSVHQGQGACSRRRSNLDGWFDALAQRLSRVRRTCGDWSRVVTPSVTEYVGSMTGVFLDPPYSAETGRDPRCYRVDSWDVAHEVREWALANGDNPKLRIALCGYEGEHDMPRTWECIAWKSKGRSQNSDRERVWFSPHCLRPEDDMFGGGV